MTVRNRFTDYGPQVEILKKPDPPAPKKAAAAGEPKPPKGA